MIAIGLNLYRLLGGKDFKHIARKDWSKLDGLKTSGLQHVFRYWDAQTDDLRLTTRLMEEAGRLGATVHYGATFQRAQCTPGHCQISFATAAGMQSAEAKAMVNASGPWVNSVLAKISPAIKALAIEWVQGAHIVVPGRLKHGIYYLESPLDQRAVFVMPWQGQTMIGTTETPYHGDPAKVTPLESEMQYLLDTYNEYFQKPLKRPQIIDSFAGLRVLPTGVDRPFNRSRETRLYRARKLPNVLSIYGGKLTSHQHTALRVLKKLAL